MHTHKARMLVKVIRIHSIRLLLALMKWTVMFAKRWHQTMDQDTEKTRKPLGICNIYI